MEKLHKNFFALTDNSQNFCNFLHPGLRLVLQLVTAVSVQCMRCSFCLSKRRWQLVENTTTPSNCETEGRFSEPSCFSSFSHAVIVFWKTINQLASNQDLLQAFPHQAITFYWHAVSILETIYGGCSKRIFVKSTARLLQVVRLRSTVPQPFIWEAHRRSMLG